MVIEGVLFLLSLMKETFLTLYGAVAGQQKPRFPYLLETGLGSAVECGGKTKGQKILD